MTNRERVLALIRSEPEGIADSEIRRRTGIEPHQQVNQICRKLAQAGLIDRRRRDGRLTNLPPGSPERNPKPRERRALDTQPAKRFVRRTHAVDGAEIPPLTISRTLFVLPCSGAKRKGGRREDNGPSVLDLLPPSPGCGAGRSTRRQCPGSECRRIRASAGRRALHRQSVSGGGRRAWRSRRDGSRHPHHLGWIRRRTPFRADWLLRPGIPAFHVAERFGPAMSGRLRGRHQADHRGRFARRHDPIRASIPANALARRSRTGLPCLSGAESGSDGQVTPCTRWGL